MKEQIWSSLVQITCTFISLECTSQSLLGVIITWCNRPTCVSLVSACIELVTLDSQDEVSRLQYFCLTIEYQRHLYSCTHVHVSGFDFELDLIMMYWSDSFLQVNKGILADGFPLPDIPHVKVERANVTVVDHALAIGADFSYLKQSRRWWANGAIHTVQHPRRWRLLGADVQLFNWFCLCSQFERELS